MGRYSAYFGFDKGSIGTNLAVIDGESNLLDKRYLMTLVKPIEAVKQGLEEIYIKTRRESGDYRHWHH